MKLIFTKSEKDVINAIKGIKRLPVRGRTFLNHKRHDKAIETLKKKGWIKKGSDDILFITADGLEAISKFWK